MVDGQNVVAILSETKWTTWDGEFTELDGFYLDHQFGYNLTPQQNHEQPLPLKAAGKKESNFYRKSRHGKPAIKSTCFNGDDFAKPLQKLAEKSSGLATPPTVQSSTYPPKKEGLISGQLP